ncbi:hypothetical protein ARMSODRAFT_11170 [Armillaria solidipes]|uniref:Uncharacterized protein n=1 Tax=Armillaria solidipes TaxID=1076256 RepID=A0A2H3CRB3_9AGAR|nr:hypothetical protein ARMSODRAFT_11170 [Armillaria solidipes]
MQVLDIAAKGVLECQPGTPSREGGSNAGHEKIYMTPQIFNVFLSKLMSNGLCMINLFNSSLS